MFEFINEEERGQVGIGTLIVFIAMVLVAAIAAGVLINTAGFLQTQAEATGEESTSQVVDRIEVQSETGLVAAVTDDDIASSDGASSDDLVLYGVDLTVTQAPGAGDIDLEEVTAELITDNGVEQIVLGNGIDDIDAPLEDQESADGETIDSSADTGSVEPVYISEITQNGDDSVITDSSDRYQISLVGYAFEDEDTTTDVYYSFEESVPMNSDNEVADSSVEANQAWAGDLDGGDTMEVRLTTASGATTITEVRVPDSLIDRDAVAL
ncbi:flagellin [Halorubrum sp. JWXQ-INN 858]|uniref:archaellin/type IV pilin N-terminal domain-containing protein n=1 Tax=Halorubrum sp. JWXQ-INN 858 TaxID=2690782 RepID=UPI0013593A9C|nr:archaellin/type IV pilin N-terminal domain-containing protein [Halorubrum sp. JWXQ-INN 858]MWV63675.1 flagellin [Halorubrum sp. JWXQ-INN 858]